MAPVQVIVPLLVVYFMSSSSLLVLNKIAITAIPNASFLLLVQLGSTVVMITLSALVGETRMNFKPHRSFVLAYSSVAVVFLATIYSNFQVIDSIGINPFIVLRCSTPILVSLLDWMFMGRTLPDRRSALALFGILVSSLLYTRLKVGQLDPDSTHTPSDMRGIWWSIVWLVSFCLDMVYIKYVVEKYPCSGAERTLYQNFLALPFLVGLLLFQFEEHSFSTVKEAPLSAYVALILTCFAGTGLSYTGMSLRTELTATLFTVLGIACKMASTMLNEVFVQPERDGKRLACVGAVIVSSAFYRQAPIR